MPHYTRCIPTYGRINTGVISIYRENGRGYIEIAFKFKDGQRHAASLGLRWVLDLDNGLRPVRPLVSLDNGLRPVRPLVSPATSGTGWSWGCPDRRPDGRW